MRRRITIAMGKAELIRHIAKNRGMHSLVTPTRPLALRPEVGVEWHRSRWRPAGRGPASLSRPIARSVDRTAIVAVR
jgi:hypothetical protein